MFRDGMPSLDRILTLIPFFFFFFLLTTFEPIDFLNLISEPFVQGPGILLYVFMYFVWNLNFFSLEKKKSCSDLSEYRFATHPNLASRA